MRAAKVVLLEETNRVGALLTARMPNRSWVLASARDLDGTLQELRDAKPAIVIVEYRPRFIEVLAWILEHRREVRVIVLLECQPRDLARELMGLGVRLCLAEEHWPQFLPWLLDCLVAGAAPLIRREHR